MIPNVMISDFVRLFYYPEETLDTSHFRLNIIKMKKKKQKGNRITRKIKILDNSSFYLH